MCAGDADRADGKVRAAVVADGKRMRCGIGVDNDAAETVRRGGHSDCGHRRQRRPGDAHVLHPHAAAADAKLPFQHGPSELVREGAVIAAVQGDGLRYGRPFQEVPRLQLDRLSVCCRDQGGGQGRVEDAGFRYPHRLVLAGGYGDGS